MAAGCEWDQPRGQRSVTLGTPGPDLLFVFIAIIMMWQELSAIKAVQSFLLEISLKGPKSCAVSSL